MSKPLSKEEYLDTQKKLFMLAGMVRELPLHEFINMINRSETLSPILNPTLEMVGAPKRDLVKRLAIALRKFQVEIPTQEEARELDERAEREAALRGVEIDP